MGGHWGAELKYAGWDAIIVEGKSDKPVYLAIVDAKVEIRDASHLWGSGIYHTTNSICQQMGPETQVAAIGQAGENLVRMASHPERASSTRRAASAACSGRRS